MLARSATPRASTPPPSSSCWSPPRSSRSRRSRPRTSPSSRMPRSGAWSPSRSPGSSTSSSAGPRSTSARRGSARPAAARCSRPRRCSALVFAVVFTSEVPDAAALGGIALTIAGAYLISDPGGGRRARLRDSGFALATAAAWALSPILTVEGLEELDSPLLGVTLGMLAAAIAYGGLLAITRTPVRGAFASRDALKLKLLAGDRRRVRDLGALDLARRHRRRGRPRAATALGAGGAGPGADHLGPPRRDRDREDLGRGRAGDRRLAGPDRARMRPG